MKHLFEKLQRGSPEEKLEAFISIEAVLGSLKKLDATSRDDFVALGQFVSKYDEWDDGTKRRFHRGASAVETAAKSAGLVIDQDGYRVR